MSFCRFCGTRLPINALVCPQCGRSLQLAGEEEKTTLREDALTAPSQRDYVTDISEANRATTIKNAHDSNIEATNPNSPVQNDSLTEISQANAFTFVKREQGLDPTMKASRSPEAGTVEHVEPDGKNMNQVLPDPLPLLAANKFTMGGHTPVVHGTPGIGGAPVVHGTPGIGGAPVVHGTPGIGGAPVVHGAPNAIKPHILKSSSEVGKGALRHLFTTTAAKVAAVVVAAAIVTTSAVVIIPKFVPGGNSNTTVATSVAATSVSRSGTSVASTASSIQTVAMPPTQTSCPTAGTGRAAVTALLKSGNHNAIVYLSNAAGTDATSSTATLSLYDTKIHKNNPLSQLTGSYITEAQVSPDGRWVLFVALTNNQYELQMVRLDGQGLQTLLCVPAAQLVNYPPNQFETDLSHVQWSPDQKSVIFTESNRNDSANGSVVYLFDMTSGKLQVELSPTVLGGVQGGYEYAPLKWLDQTKVYVTRDITGIDGGVPAGLYLLDTTKGPDQKDTDLQTVIPDASFTTALFCWTIDTSLDSTQLFVSQCPATQGGPAAGTSTISRQPASGGSGIPVYQNTDHAISIVRVASKTSLLFTLSISSPLGATSTADTTQNGLWLINMDGTGAKQLSNQTISLNAFNSSAWSNVSRDGSLYACSTSVANGTNTTETLAFGGLNGGPLTPFTEPANIPLSSPTLQNIVGWTLA